MAARNAAPRCPETPRSTNEKIETTTNTRLISRVNTRIVKTLIWNSWAHAPRADIGIMEPDSDDEESTQLVAQMGCSTQRAPTRRKNRPKATTATTREVIVSEIYSPPRIIQLLREMRAQRSKQVKHIMPGFAFDLTTNDPDDGKPWDFSTESKKNKARAYLREQKPYLLVGSLM